jgi:hypothetical protein
MNTITKKHSHVLFSINKLTLKLYVNTITNSVYFVYSAVNKLPITKSISDRRRFFHYNYFTIACFFVWKR